MKSILIISLFLLSLSISEKDFDENAPWSIHFTKIFAEVKKIPMKKISVAAAEDSNVLEAVNIARERGIADAILVGNEEKLGKYLKN